MVNEVEKFKDSLNDLRSFVFSHKDPLTKHQFRSIMVEIDCLLFDLDYFFSDLYSEEKKNEN